MFEILSSALKTATREDHWNPTHHTPEDRSLISEMNRRAGYPTGRWVGSKKRDS